MQPTPHPSLAAARVGVRPRRGRAAGAFVAAAVLLAGACSSGETTAAPGDASGGGDASNTTTPTTNTAPPGEGPAVASAGCEAGEHPAVKAEKRTMEVAGEERYFLLTVPEDTASVPAPLIFDFHGLMEGAEVASMASLLPELGQREGFITIVPNGRGNPVRWDVGLDPADNPDMAFVEAMLDTVSAEQCVDTSRVYATGLSNGAAMTSAVACAFPNRFAAVAPVAGLLSQCDSADRPIPVLGFHGTADPILFFNGGTGDLGGLLTGGTNAAVAPEADLEGEGYPAYVAAWAERNGCQDSFTDERIADDVIQRTYDCPAGADVVFDIVVGGGHSWPGSEFNMKLENIMGPTTPNLDASAAMWEFFGHFQLPAS
jgi:polyhydroxybutyrate depolymerase